MPERNEPIIGDTKPDTVGETREKANRVWERQYRAFGLPKNTVTAIISVGIIAAFVLSTMGVGAAAATATLGPFAGIAFNHYVNKGKMGS